MVKKQKHKRYYIRNSVVILILLTTCMLAWLLYRNTTLFRQDKDSLESRIDNVINSIELPGELVYKNIEDVGCSDRLVGLQVSYSCGYTGYKFYKNTGEVKESVDEIRNAATALGLKPLSLNTFSDGKGVGDRKEIILEIGSYQSGAVGESQPIKSLIDRGTVPQPIAKEQEYIYGFQIRAIYYYCANESFFKQPCPYPPSEPKPL